MNTRFFLSLMVILSFVFSAVNCPAEVAYTVTDLGILGGKSSIAIAINNSGQIVGRSDIDDGYIGLDGNYRHYHHAYLYYNGQMTDIGALAGKSSIANNINDLGHIVGVSSNSVPYAMLWRDGAAIDLGSIDDLNSWSHAYDINNNDQIVGVSSYSDGGGGDHAFLWQNGTMIDLGVLEPGSGYSGATAINDIGQIVGWSGNIYNESGRAFIWQNGVMTQLRNLNENSLAYDINNLGQVVGITRLDKPSRRSGFLWQDGVITRFDMVPQAINNFGVTVGYDKSAMNACIWQNGVVTELNTLIDPNLGWMLKEALDINDHGQIVGYGYHNQQVRSFLLTPVPEPGSFAVLALGMTPLMLALKRKRK